VNKSDLIESMASAAGISKAAAEKGLNGMLDAVTKALKRGDKVTLVGFGTFSVAKRAARQGRNPQTLCVSMKSPPTKIVSTLDNLVGLYALAG
jgi:DNA-binding protein HU-beta